MRIRNSILKHSQGEVDLIVSLRDMADNRTHVRVQATTGGRLVDEMTTYINESDENRFDPAVQTFLSGIGLPTAGYLSEYSRLISWLDGPSNVLALFTEEYDFESWKTRMFVRSTLREIDTGWQRGIDACFHMLLDMGIVVRCCSNCRFLYHIDNGVYDPQYMAICSLETRTEHPTLGDVHGVLETWLGSQIVSLNDVCPSWDSSEFVLRKQRPK